MNNSGFIIYVRQFRDPVSTDGSTLVSCFNKEFFDYTTALTPTPACRKTARLYTPILTTLSEGNYTFDLCCYSSYVRIQFVIICCSVAVGSATAASCSVAVDFGVVASCSVAVDFGVVASCSAVADSATAASCSVVVDSAVAD